MQQLRPEPRYLLDLARAWASDREGPVAPPAGIDPAAFTRLFGNQPAMQTLLPWLDADHLPQRERAQLHQAAEISRRRTTVLLLELERILPALAESGCQPVVLKGASLALTIYDRPEDRWFLDLDLLIRPEKLSAAYDALARLGYRFAATACPPRYYEDHHFHRILVSNQGVYIEVHWAVTMPASVYGFDLEALRRASVEIPLGYASFQAPSALDQVLHGVLQSVAGGYADLRRILDLHLLDARLDDEHRRLLAARAHAANLSTALWLQYRLREQLLEAAMPAAIDAACRPTPSVLRLFDRLRVAANCLAPAPPRVEGYDYLLHCLCVPRPLRAREMRRYLFPDQGGLLEAGLGRDGSIPWRQRLRLHLSRLRAALRLGVRVGRAALQRGPYQLGASSTASR
jgi:hypothetical protein